MVEPIYLRPANLAYECRRRERLVRAEADVETNAQKRATLLTIADVWRRMAKFEDRKVSGRSSSSPWRLSSRASV
jgi:hypothetical protein